MTRDAARDRLFLPLVVDVFNVERMKLPYHLELANQKRKNRGIKYQRGTCMAREITEDR